MISFQIIDSGNKDEDQGRKERKLQRGREGGRECSLGTMLTEPLLHTLCIIVAKKQAKRERGGKEEAMRFFLPSFSVVIVTSANKMTAAEELGKGRWMDRRERAKFPMRDKQERDRERGERVITKPGWNGK